MTKKHGVDKMKRYCREKRKELVWALSEQEYSYADIASIFGINKSSIKRMVDKKPKNYKPKWQKVRD